MNRVVQVSGIAVAQSSSSHRPTSTAERRDFSFDGVGGRRSPRHPRPPLLAGNQRLVDSERGCCQSDIARLPVISVRACEVKGKLEAKEQLTFCLWRLVRLRTVSWGRGSNPGPTRPDWPEK